MSLATVRAQIKTILETISTVKNIYDYQRYVKDWATYKTRFTTDRKVNTWEITRSAFERNVMGSDATERVIHEFLIRGFYAVDDSEGSDKVFQDIVESVGQVFRDKPDLNDIAEVIIYPITATIRIDMFGGVLCHVVEITLNVQERIVFG